MIEEEIWPIFDDTRYTLLIVNFVYFSIKAYDVGSHSDSNEQHTYIFMVK